MPVDFSAARKNAEREGQIQGGDYFKFKEGPNRLRLLNMPLPHPGTYKGTRTFKWLCYVIDREAGDIKVFFMPHVVFKQLEALQQNEDYRFDDMPMPYDLTINAKGAGTKNVEYTVVPGRTNRPLTPAEEAMLAEKKPIEEVQAALFAKNAERNGEDHPDYPGTPEHPNGTFDPDDLPFP